MYTYIGIAIMEQNFAREEFKTVSTKELVEFLSLK